MAKISAVSREDFAYEMNTALKEVRETHYWPRLARDMGLIDFSIVEPALKDVRR